jgi:hypothetical protein
VEPPNDTACATVCRQAALMRGSAAGRCSGGQDAAASRDFRRGLWTSHPRGHPWVCAGATAIIVQVGRKSAFPGTATVHPIDAGVGCARAPGFRPAPRHTGPAAPPVAVPAAGAGAAGAKEGAVGGLAWCWTGGGDGGSLSRCHRCFFGRDCVSRCCGLHMTFRWQDHDSLLAWSADGARGVRPLRSLRLCSAPARLPASAQVCARPCSFVLLLCSAPMERPLPLVHHVAHRR